MYIIDINVGSQINSFTALLYFAGEPLKLYKQVLQLSGMVNPSNCQRYSNAAAIHIILTRILGWL